MDWIPEVTISISPPIEFNQVKFSYRNQTVLDDFSFSFEPSGLVAMVGVNGSGKSTLLKLILGLLQPQSGEIQVLGHKAGSFVTKGRIGSALQDVDFPQSERVEEIVNFVCSQYPTSLPVDELVEHFQLQEFRKKACGQLSGGMKRRVALACAFAGRPQLVLLDEPTTGLDQDSRLRLMQTLRSYQQEHKALILLISHHPEEIMDSVDGFLHVKNRQVEKLSTATLKESMQLRKLKFKLQGDHNLPEARRVTRNQETCEVVTENSDQYITSLVTQKIPFRDLTVDKLNIEELLGDFL